MSSGACDGEVGDDMSRWAVQKHLRLPTSREKDQKKRKRKRDGRKKWQGSVTKVTSAVWLSGAQMTSDTLGFPSERKHVGSLLSAAESYKKTGNRFELRSMKGSQLWLAETLPTM